ncbi:serine protease [Actinorhabdospora filicis]|uniref:Serine protease n=1 Tax=Actinorhabdospora filicis TaxID=1785913 RepID=A0A9W6W780_9ACTN|nr:S8 family serine peptidase [Actinorhabdospora filicis]GLZ76279.1 serine protease [Actinorhabdospora filicis]
MKHQRGKNTRRGLAAIGAAVLAAALIPAQQAAADPPAAAPPKDGRPHTVSLITGDRVTVDADGRLTFRPGAGREGIGHRTVTSKDGTLVLPDDAAALVASGTVERRLFDVTGLIEDGFADRATLPLIVAGGGSARMAAEGTALESIGATATTPSDLGGWWAGLASARRATAVEHVWLDAPGRLSLDVSVPQVSAPTAWQAGYDGTGVTIAVLDTGYDPTHPDLAGRVAKARDFTGTSPEAVDGYGHGTHVASILAGTGAASEGRYKGVAPGASLLIGKVCDDLGRCPMSKVIEAMEWAADEGATAISMSLGWPVWPGEVSPVALASDAVSERTGTLVVAAAGNDGYDASVEAPALADSALAVGSVTKSDEYSEFSSRGPRESDRAAKPDIAAPGSGITAARAAGTPGEGPYAAHSGTSMATPHVAGAVALLKQRHPDWSGPRLKAALMNSAKVLDGQTAYQQGAGRLDVARAFAQDLTVDGSVSFAYTNFPAPAEPKVKTVTYTNDGDAEVTLNLATTGPSGLFTVDTATVTVPAKGTATVDVSLHPGAFPGGGDFPGSLVATGGGIAVHTVLTASMEREAYELTVSATPRAGEDHTGSRMLGYNPDTDETIWFSVGADGTGTARVAPGRYILVGGFESSAPGEDLPRMTFTGRDVTVTADRHEVFDLGRAVEADIDATDRTDETALDLNSSIGIGTPGGGGINAVDSGRWSRYFTLAEPAPAGLETDWSVSTALIAPGVYYDLATRADWVPRRLDLAYADAELARTLDVYEAQAAGTVTGTRSDTRPDVEAFPVIRPVTLPSTETGYHVPGTWRVSLEINPDDFDQREYEFRPYTAVAGATTRERWNAAPLSPAFEAHPYRYADNAFMFRMMMFSGPLGLRASSDGTTTSVTLDGKPLAVDARGTYFEVPEGTAGRFEVTFDTTRDFDWSGIGKRSVNKWAFDSAPTKYTDLPVSSVRLNTTGVRDGYASALLPQLVTLTEEHTAAKPKTTSLTFEVSYDDGRSWTKVPVVRAGNSAYAVLIHPRGATSVSTRMSTVDAGGNTSEQTMIRSYALR